jgi:hypothetical protein
MEIYDENDNNNNNIVITTTEGKMSNNNNKRTLGDITNNSNSNNNSNNNKSSKFSSTHKTKNNKNNTSLEKLQKDVERLAIKEAHEFETDYDSSSFGNMNNNKVLGEFMEELILEYSEREQSQSYYYNTIEQASARAAAEVYDLCRF